MGLTWRLKSLLAIVERTSGLSLVKWTPNLASTRKRHSLILWFPFSALILSSIALLQFKEMFLLHVEVANVSRPKKLFNLFQTLVNLAVCLGMELSPMWACGTFASLIVTFLSISLWIYSYCKMWEKEGLDVTVIELEGAEHREILSDNRLHSLITRVILAHFSFRLHVNLFLSFLFSMCVLIQQKFSPFQFRRLYLRIWTKISSLHMNLKLR